MFDLRFHKYVRETLDWDEAPGTIFLNSHMGLMEKRKAQSMHGNAAMLKDREELRLYISTTYSIYFGVVLRIGEATLKNRHLIANHPALNVAFD
jgi:hypothetical protein